MKFEGAPVIDETEPETVVIKKKERKTRASRAKADADTSRPVIGLPGDAKSRVGEERIVIPDDVVTDLGKQKEYDEAIADYELNNPDGDRATRQHREKTFQNVKKWEVGVIGSMDKLEKAQEKAIHTPEELKSANIEQLPGREELHEVFERAKESPEFREEIAEAIPYTPVPVDQQIEPVIDAFAVGLSTPEELKEMIKDETDVTLLKQNRETRQTAYDELVEMTATAREQGNTASLKKLIEYTDQQQRALQIIDERIAALGPKVGDKTEIIENRFGKFMRRVFGLPRIWKKRE